MSIINEINERASTLQESDLDEWIVPGLMDHFDARIKALARYSYGSAETYEASSMAHLAFKERAKAEVRHGMHTFLFVSEHWRNERDINSYLLTCLKRLATRIRDDAEATRKTNIPICPACKSLGHRQYCRYENRVLRCYHCLFEITRLEDELKNTTESTVVDRLEAQLYLRKAFAVHSRKGCRCPDCSRFVPDTFIKNHGPSCPYPDCSFFGEPDDLEPMAHPLGLGSDMPLSLNEPIFKVEEAGKAVYWQDKLQTNDVNADVKLEFNEKYNRELDVLKQVIADQISSIKRNNPDGKSIQKLLMYEAYSNLVKRQPDDMIHYLVHMKHSGELPLQAIIFQEYIRLVENSLPFNIFRGGKQIEILSLLDPNLNLFLGTSEFDATVRSDHAIPNNTVETYTGGRKLKFFGPCFIGLVVNIVDRDTEESLLSKIKSYSFVQIKMNDQVSPGTRVRVTHFRIASHYEMGALVNLQRIRRKLVDSIFLRLNGSKREVRPVKQIGSKYQDEFRDGDEV